MEFLIARTGMTLNPGQVADLVLTWRQVSALAATIPRAPVPADDFAFAFRLPLPGPAARASTAAKAGPPPKAAAKAAAPKRVPGKAAPASAKPAKSGKSKR